jgi:hypothetical protein
MRPRRALRRDFPTGEGSCGSRSVTLNVGGHPPEHNQFADYSWPEQHSKCEERPNRRVDWAIVAANKPNAPVAQPDRASDF